MKTTLLSCLLAALATASCGAAPADPTVDRTTLTGRWLLATTTVTNTCPSEGELSPWAPGAVAIREAGDELTLEDSAGNASRYAGQGRTWESTQSFTADGCQAFVTQRWTLAGSAGNRLSALLDTQLETTGDCAAAALSSCRARLAVNGVRQP